MRITAKQVGIFLIALFIVGILAAAFAPSIGNSLPPITSGFAVQEAWNIPSINSQAFPYNYAALQSLTHQFLLPPIPVFKNYTASNQLSLEFNQFEQVLTDLLQHTGVLGASDQAHRDLAVTGTLQPFFQAYSPAQMAQIISPTVLLILSVVMTLTGIYVLKQKN